MRIQHNIMAMNAYRNYTNNTSALSKNLEKLSSGYRINRAGDDAAGLAISEKMRAQITALGTAQKNVKDGISLVKTAEGATQEIHDMLNRMVSLAEQSANGTYQDEVDREAIVDEFNALKSEINRIADASNFNGITLLDGSLNGEGAKTVLKGVDRMLATDFAAGDDPIDEVGKKTMLDGASSPAANAKFTVDFSGMTAGAGAPAGTAAVYSYQVGGTSTAADGDTIALSGGISISVKNDGSGDITATDATDNTKLAAAIAAKLEAAGNADYTITSQGDKVIYTAKTPGAIAGEGPAAAPIDHETTTANRGVTMGAQVEETAGADATAAAPEITFTLGGTDLAANVALADGDDAKAIATKVFAALADSNDTQIDGNSFKVTDNGDGTLTFELNGDPADVQGNYDWDVSVDAGAISGAHTAGTSVVTPGSAGAAGTVANTVFEITAADLTDGAVIELDGKKVTLSVGADSKVKDGSGVVKLTDADLADINLALGKISAGLGGEGDNFIIGVNDTSNGDAKSGLTVHKKASSTNTYDTREKLGAIFSLTTTGAATGTGLTLQIGDTSDDFNKLTVSIADMHTDSLGLDSLDLGKQKGAADAVKVIKDAINMVSTTRGRLGATQNRLEHTANNLSTMKENIQDAEATIRDTDIAEEMMAYTKNNILVQSAQAMLAQANQIPQGVLQLLG